MKKLFLLFIVLFIWASCTEDNDYVKCQERILNQSGYSVTLEFTYETPNGVLPIAVPIVIEKDEELNTGIEKHIDDKFPMFFLGNVTLTSITFNGDRYLDLTDPANDRILKITTISSWTKVSELIYEFTITKEDYERALPIT